MDLRKMYKPGDRIKLVDNRGEHIASIDEVVSADTMVVIRPWEVNNTFSVYVGKHMNTVCSNARGIHKCLMAVVGMEKSENVDTLRLKYVDNYSVIQNRRAYRCEVTVPVEVRRSGEPWEKTKTLDLSSTGLRVRLSNRYKLGEHVQIQVLLDRFGFDIMLPIMSGVIVRVKPTPDDTRNIICGINFDNMNSSTEDTISKFVVVYQRKNMGERGSKK